MVTQFKVHNFEPFCMPTAREKMKMHQNEVVNAVVSMPEIPQYIYSAIYTKAKTITSLGTTREAQTLRISPTFPIPTTLTIYEQQWRVAGCDYTEG